VLATSTEKSDDVLCDLTTGLGVTVFRGSETDVLGRFIGAATLTDATNVVRVCADNPFIDPIEIDRLVNFFFDNPCDYACNHQDRLGSGYADGFGAEICSVLTLKKINDAANDMRYREHATLYIWENSSEFKIKVIEAPLGLRHPKLRFDIDTPEDLIRMKQYVNGGVTTNTTASEIIRFSLTIS
jgi:spore coat polysaccharide biosynthesis protein SpsF